MTRESIGLAQAAKPWTSRKKLLGVPAGARVRQLLDIVYWKRRISAPGISEEEFIQDCWVHISKSMERLPYQVGSLPCLVAGSQFYSMQFDTTISGRAHMQVIGWPECYLDDADGLSDHEYRDLAGNAFSVPLAALLSACMIMNRYGPWWSESEKSGATSSDRDDCT